MSLVRKRIGSALLGLGFVGMFFPLLQGTPLFVIGLALLSPRNSYLKGLLEKAGGRCQDQAARIYEIMEQWPTA